MRNGLLLRVSAFALAGLLACAAPPAAPRQAPANAPDAAPRQAPANVSDAAGQAAPVHPPALQAVIDAARQEGTLDLVWAEGVVGGREGVSRLAEGLKRRYGLNLDIRFTPGLNMAEMAPRLV